MSRFQFNKTAIDSLSPPPQRKYYYDEKVRGLALLVTPAGAKSFYFYRKIAGRPQRVTIGKWPDITVEQARRLATEKNVDAANGKDVMQDRRNAREIATFGELWDYYLENHAKPRKRSWEADERQYKAYLKNWKARPLPEIKPADCQTLIARMGNQNGKVAANRARTLVCTMFNVAMKELGQDTNPMAGVKPFKEQPRERYLNADEVNRLQKVINNIESIQADSAELWRDFFLLALYTGARRGNLTTLQQSEIDLQAGVWTIPATKAKAGVAIRVPLTAEALEVIRRRIKAVGKGPWLFPSRRRDGHITEPIPIWLKICAAAGLEGVRIHDLRHTVASWMVAGGASLYTVGKALGHTDQSTTQRYAHLELDALRAAMGTATAAMNAKPKSQKKGQK